MRLLRFFGTLVLILAFAPNIALAKFPKAYVGAQHIKDVSLSPDGAHVAVLRKGERYKRGPKGWDAVEIRAVGDNTPLVIHQTDERAYYWVNWLSDDLLFAAGRQYDIGKRKVTGREFLAVLNPKADSEQLIFQMPKVDKLADVKGFKFLKFSKPHNAVVLQYPDRKKTKLVKIDLDGAKQSTIDEGGEDIVSWYVDDDLAPYLRIDKEKYDHIRKFHERGEDGKWQHFQTINTLETDFRHIKFDRETMSYLVLARPKTSNLTGIYRLALSNMSKLEPVYSHAKFDIATVVRKSFEGTMLYASWWDDTLKHHWFNDGDRQIAARLSRHLKPNDNYSVVESDKSHTKWLIYVSGASNPGTYGIWDDRSGVYTVLDKARPGLTADTLAKRERIDYRAADGLKLSGYFTPAMKKRDDDPFIVIPHGGPVARDNMDWDGWAQFLAYRGYSVFQPNFRGSSGLGREFEEKGHLQWGRKMQTDIEDGVRHLQQMGKLPRNGKKAIIGASYGGYAALMAAAKTPGRYRCVMSINGVTDPINFMGKFDTSDPVDKMVRDIWVRRIGDPKADQDTIKSISPIHKLDAMRSTILLLHGSIDEIVPVEQSRTFFKKAKEKGLAITYSELPGVGHGGWSDDTSTKILSDIETFLMTCMNQTHSRYGVKRTRAEGF